MVLAIYQIILHLNKITECLKMTTFKIVFTLDVFFSAETTMHCKVTCILYKPFLDYIFVSIPYIGLVFTSHENRWRHFTDNKSCQIIESILKYKNGFKSLKMTTFKIVFTLDVFFSAETTMHCKVTCILYKKQAHFSQLFWHVLFTSTISDPMTNVKSLLLKT
jgi:DNA modification methylase